MCFSRQRSAIFPDPNFKKKVREWCVLHILTCKCASRCSGVQFFHIPTSKSDPTMVFAHFNLQMCFSLQRRVIFAHLNFKKWSENVLLATAACNCSFLLQRATSAPAALPRLLFDPADPQIIEKTQPVATFLTFRACGYAFF